MKSKNLLTCALILALVACGQADEDEEEDSGSPEAAATAENETDASSPSALIPSFETRSDGAMRLTDPPTGASDQNPAFSPDGATILFTRFDAGYNEGPAGLYLLDFSTGEIGSLFWEDDQDAVNLPGTSWNPVTGRIAFSSDREDIDEVWTLLPDGSDLFRVTNHSPDSFYLEPSFSPDGEWIVFEASPDVPDDEQQSSIWKIRADGSEPIRLTDGPAGGSDDRQPNWSPTGERILFQRREASSENWDIYTMAPDGSDVRRVTTSPGGDTDASWSPDGQWIVYSSDDDRLPTPSLFAIPVDGGEPIQVTHNDTRYDGAPSWSPDGDWIAFESYPGDEDQPSTLWLIAAPDLLVPGGTGRSRMTDVTTWFYMIDVNLEDEMVDQVAGSEYDLVVLDFIPSESSNTDFPMADVVDALHQADHPKLVVAYIDIGQAESYRTYWQDGWGIGNPEWIAAEDPDGWVENYPVAYWYEEWQSIWLGPSGTIAQIVAAGFDGVYLDWVEAYSDLLVAEMAERDGVDAEQEMVWWVEAIAEQGRSLDEEFIVIGQNAAELVENDEYVAIVDAVSQEQVWFDGSADDDPPGDCPLPRSEAEVESDAYVESLSEDCLYLYETYPDSTLHVSSESYLYYLLMALDKGLVVLTVDYAVLEENIAWVFEQSRSYGFIPFVSNRALDQFVPVRP